MTKLLLLSLFLLGHSSIFSQCIGRDKITYGGDWGYTDYIHRCPTYSFAYGGDTSRNWNVLNDPIDIFQAPENIIILKKHVDNKIKEFSGDDFFSRIKFNEVEVVYPDKLKAFKDSGRDGVTLKFCKAKYLFYYDYIVDSLMRYHIGVAVNDKGEIISPFNFPSNSEYAPIDTTFNYCKLIHIARQVQTDIEPIKEISFEFDTKTKRFFWLIIEKIKDEKEGLNHINQVMIDASNLAKTKLIKAKVYVDY